MVADVESTESGYEYQFDQLVPLYVRYRNICSLTVALVCIAHVAVNVFPDLVITGAVFAAVPFFAIIAP